MCFGAAHIGAIFCPLNTWYKPPELAWALRHGGLRLLVSASHFIKQDYTAVFSALIPELGHASEGDLRSKDFPHLKALAFAGTVLPGAFGHELLDLASTVSDATFLSAAGAITPDDAIFILYTSGSTAEPKGVLLQHGNAVANGFDMGERRFVTGEDRVWLGTPLFYALGAINAMPVALTHGAAIVLQDYFEAGAAIETIRSTQATVYYRTGNMSRAILDHPDYEQRKIGTLKKGNAGTYTEYKRMTLVEMGITLASAAYGLTESYGNATVSPADDPIEPKLATNGPPLPGTELLIVDASTQSPLPQGETGLIPLHAGTLRPATSITRRRHRARSGPMVFSIPAISAALIQPGTSSSIPGSRRSSRAAASMFLRLKSSSCSCGTLTFATPMWSACRIGSVAKSLSRSSTSIRKSAKTK
jgi:fatty-acyl-CoA synthase